MKARSRLASLKRGWHRPPVRRIGLHLCMPWCVTYDSCPRGYLGTTLTNNRSQTNVHRKKDTPASRESHAARGPVTNHSRTNVQKQSRGPSEHIPNHL